MLHDKSNEDGEVEDATPVKVIPFEEAFKEDLYNLYEVYRPERTQSNYYFDI